MSALEDAGFFVEVDGDALDAAAGHRDLPDARGRHRRRTRRAPSRSRCAESPSAVGQAGRPARRDERIALHENRHVRFEPDAHADPRRRPDPRRRGTGAPASSHTSPPPHEVGPVLGRSTAERLRELPGPRAQVAGRGPRPGAAAIASSPSSGSTARRSTALPSPVRTGHHVHHPVVAVGEVHVEVPRRPEHRRVARRRAAEARGSPGRPARTPRPRRSVPASRAPSGRRRTRTRPSSVGRHLDRGPRRRTPAAGVGGSAAGPCAGTARSFVSGQALITSSFVSQPRCAVATPNRMNVEVARSRARRCRPRTARRGAAPTGCARPCRSSRSG